MNDDMNQELTKVVGFFDEAEQSTDISRAESELHRDYYDGKQLTAKEEATLKSAVNRPSLITRSRIRLTPSWVWKSR